MNCAQPIFSLKMIKSSQFCLVEEPGGQSCSCLNCLELCDPIDRFKEVRMFDFK